MSAEAVGWVWKFSPATKSAFLVHLALADVANDMHKHELWCSTDTLSRKTRVGRTAVVEALDKLVELGLLSVIQIRPGRTTLYRFLYPELPLQFSYDPPETPVRKPDGGVRKLDDTPPESGHELNRTQVNETSRAREQKADAESWVEQDRNPDALAAVMARFGREETA